MEFDKELLARRLRGLRGEQRLSREALGKLSGVSADSILKYECERVTPSVEAVAALATALDTTPNHLLGWD